MVGDGDGDGGDDVVAVGLLLSGGGWLHVVARLPYLR